MDRSGSSSSATRIETKEVRVTDLLAVLAVAVAELVLTTKSVSVERVLLAVVALSSSRGLLVTEHGALSLGGLSSGLLGCRHVRYQLADEKSHGLSVEVGAESRVAELILSEEVLAEVSEHDRLLELACGDEGTFGSANLAAGPYQRVRTCCRSRHTEGATYRRR